MNRKELVEAISRIMECSQREAVNAVITLDNDHLEEVLYKAGYQPNEVVKIISLPFCASSRITRVASGPSGTFST